MSCFAMADSAIHEQNVENKDIRINTHFFDLCRSRYRHGGERKNDASCSVAVFQPLTVMAAPSFLSAVLNRQQEKVEQRTSVTLTFAQSLDAKIAGINGQQLILSGKESMIMTHWCAFCFCARHHLTIHKDRMRTMHDAILIGIGTALNDNPQLNSMWSSYFRRC